jgi:adenine-specific DNA-methyltransferase
MAKIYRGSLTLDWYNKQKSILLAGSEETTSKEIPAPAINWVNKDDALFYEVKDSEGKGVAPYWVNGNDIRIKEARTFLFQKAIKAQEKDVPGTIPGTSRAFDVSELQHDDASIENILIKGDNLLTLNSLKKRFENKLDSEKIKCIYIDPPYNTGSAFVQYDDNLAHSEWLTLMRDRLIVLRDLLTEDGSIWISMDDEEIHYLKVLCDSIFGRENFITTIIWQQRTTRENRKVFSNNHEYILAFAKNYEAFKASRNDLELTEEVLSRYENPDNDPRGSWQSVSANAQAGHATKDQFYTLKAPNGKEHVPPEGRCWVYTKKRMDEEIEKGRIWFGKEGNGVPRIKKYHSEIKAGLTPETLWLATTSGTNDSAKKEQIKINKEDLFETPKPEQLIYNILQIATNEGELVLDCFAGSGTTLAVAHKMGRKWIGVEIGKHVESHIIKRLKNVAGGTDKIGVTGITNWQGGGAFKYYLLGESIIKLNENGIGDFNWSLGKTSIENALLSSYDYVLDTSINLDEGKLFDFQEMKPVIGVQLIGSKSRVAIVSINEPNGKLSIMPYDEISSLYQAVKQKFAPEYINIFTNRGVEMAYDSKPDDLEIIKIPHAIFAELEK